MKRLICTSAGVPVGTVRKEVSMRRVRPTLPDIDMAFVIDLITRWKPEYETDGDNKAFFPLVFIDLLQELWKYLTKDSLNTH